MQSVWQHVAKLNKTLMSLSSISTSGMSRTWSELAVSASKLNIAKYTWTRRCEVWQRVARLKNPHVLIINFNKQHVQNLE
jgi:hypothetical protein